MAKKKTPAPGNAPQSRRQPSPWLKEKPVGDALRHAYRDALQEPVPPKLQKLIDKLREEERKTKK